MYKQLSKPQQRTVATYFVVSASRELSMSFFATTYVLFLLSRGLNLLEANLVNTVFFVTLFVFEIPTGIVADVWGRKISTIISFWLAAVGMAVYFFAGSFLMCAAAEAISAIGMTFVTGAFDAWLVDELAFHGFSGQTRWIFSRSQQAGKIASLAGALIGAFMGGINLALPWVASAATMIATALLASASMSEQSFVRRPYSFGAGWRQIGTTWKTGTAYARKSKPVRFLVVMSVIQSVGFMAPNMQWTPWFKQLLGSSTDLGFVWWGVALMLMLGAELARGLAGNRSEQWTLCAVQIVIGACVVFAPYSSVTAYSLFFFLMHELGRGLYKPLQDAYLNANIPSAERATLLSLNAMSFHIGGAFGLVASGALANAWGIPAAWVASGIVLILGTSVVFTNGHHPKNQ